MELTNTKNVKKSFSSHKFHFFVIFLLYITSLTEVYGDPEELVSSSFSFSNVTCSEGIGNVLLTGQFNNNDTFYKVIFLKMLIFDRNGHALAMGNGYISDIKPHEIKIFDAITRFNSNFSSCSIQIDNVIPK